VTGSLFNEEEVEQTVNNAYQIHKNISFPIKSGMVIVISSGTSKSLYEQFLTNMTVNQASSQQLLFPLDLFFSLPGELSRI
jgi:DNA mismatch repair protein MutL